MVKQFAHALRRGVGLSALFGAPLVAQTLPAAHVTPAPFRAVNANIAKQISGDRALSTVAYVEQFFRLPGNRGFDASIDTVAALLRAAGYAEQSQAKSSDRLTYRVESRPMTAQAWTPDDASLTIVGRNTPLEAWATNHNMLAINSYATPEDGLITRLVDVGAGTEAELTRQDIKGAIVLVVDGNTRVAYPRALALGAAGVLATQKLPAYNQQSKNTTAIQFTSVPNDSVHRGFTIFVSSAARDSLKAALATGPVTVRAVVKARLETRPERTVVAEIRGAVRPAERFVYSAHVQEPGANDNASGVGLLAEMARAAAAMFKTGQINPARTMTFLWGDEIRSTDRFIKEDSVRRTGIKWGMSLDMVGENTALTGGTFLIEKMPDPSAVWVRGDDQHSEWGARPIKADEIRAYWYNDFVRQRCLDRAATTGWVVKSNPFEGGSDHTPFLTAKIPAVLLWHFTDQHYHTDLDRLNMVSATTLANVGNCALSTGLLLTNGSPMITMAALTELTDVAERELRTQSDLSAKAIQSGSTAAAERVILETWRDYFVAALAKINDIALTGTAPARAITAAQTRVRSTAAALLAKLGS